jgi:hypothetical protein
MGASLDKINNEIQDKCTQDENLLADCVKKENLRFRTFWQEEYDKGNIYSKDYEYHKKNFDGGAFGIAIGAVFVFCAVLGIKTGGNFGAILAGFIGIIILFCCIFLVFVPVVKETSYILDNYNVNPVIDNAEMVEVANTILQQNPEGFRNVMQKTW